MSTVSAVAWGVMVATHRDLRRNRRVIKRNHLHCGLILIAHQRDVVVGSRKPGRQLC